MQSNTEDKTKETLPKIKGTVKEIGGEQSDNGNLEINDTCEKREENNRERDAIIGLKT
jgi:uncharacterized protein YjbJ (UPF0337 family)